VAGEGIDALVGEETILTLEDVNRDMGTFEEDLLAFKSGVAEQKRVNDLANLLVTEIIQNDTVISNVSMSGKPAPFIGVKVSLCQTPPAPINNNWTDVRSELNELNEDLDSAMDADLRRLEQEMAIVADLKSRDVAEPVTINVPKSAYVVRPVVPDGGLPKMGHLAYFRVCLVDLDFNVVSVFSTRNDSTSTTWKAFEARVVGRASGGVFLYQDGGYSSELRVGIAENGMADFALYFEEAGEHELEFEALGKIVSMRIAVEGPGPEVPRREVSARLVHRHFASDGTVPDALLLRRKMALAAGVDIARLVDVGCPDGVVVRATLLSNYNELAPPSAPSLVEAVERLESFAGLAVDENHDLEPLTRCRGDQYETAEVTRTSDRVCSAFTTCDYPDLEFESVPPTNTTDRECSVLTVCDFPASEFESVAPAYASDRACKALRRCCLNTTRDNCTTVELIVRNATYDSDFVCAVATSSSEKNDGEDGAPAVVVIAVASVVGLAAAIVVVVWGLRKKAPKSTSGGVGMVGNPTYAETSLARDGTNWSSYHDGGDDLNADDGDLDDMYRTMPEGFEDTPPSSDAVPKADFGLKLSGAGWTSVGAGSSKSSYDNDGTFDDGDGIEPDTGRGFGHATARDGDISWSKNETESGSKVKRGERAGWMSTISPAEGNGPHANFDEDDFGEFEGNMGYGNTVAREGDVLYGEARSFRKQQPQEARVKEPEMKRLGSVTRARKGPVLPGPGREAGTVVDYTKSFTEWEMGDFVHAEEDLEFGFAASFDA
jgi:hypothetical protein